MDVLNAKAKVYDELSRCSSRIERDGLITKTSVWLDDKKLIECDSEPGRAAYISGEILILTEGMADEDGLVIVFTLPCRKGAVDEGALDDELVGFVAAADELIGELDESADPAIYLAERIQRTDKEAKEMMDSFGEQMRKMRRNALIFGAAVLILIIAFGTLSVLF